MKKKYLLPSIIIVSIIFPIFVQNNLIPRKKKQFKIALFTEKGLPCNQRASYLSAHWIYGQLSRSSSVTRIDAIQLANGSLFNRENFDLLILPYGGEFPQKALPVVKQFIFQGGGLLTVSGKPFGYPLARAGGKWETADNSNVYKDFLSVLGIKYFEFSDAKDIGLTVTTSLGISPVQPTRGNVFPYRIPVRDFYPINALGGLPVAEAGIFVKSWRNPYVANTNSIPRKWCLIGAQSEYLFDPKNPSAADNLTSIMRYLAFPVVIHGLETDLAAYYPQEQVRFFLKAVNTGSSAMRAEVDFEFIDEKGNLVEHMRKAIALNPHQKKTINQVWRPGILKGNFYTIRAVLTQGNSIYDKEENGFVVINNDSKNKGPALEARGKDLFIDGKKTLLLGTNYYESKSGELMWVRPNLLRVRQDFQAMRRLGMNYVRIHYHHSKWFRDYYSDVVKQKLDPYLDSADTTALPSERSLRILDAVVQLAQEEGLVLSLDLFSLVPKEMGDPIGWLSLKERVVDKNKVAVQKEFVKLISRRYKDVPCISWDLWNEPRLGKEDKELLKGWAEELVKTFRDNGDRHLITIGDDISLKLLDVLDYGSIHTYEPSDYQGLDRYSKPVIFQETWIPAGLSLQEEVRQSEELRKDFNYFLSSGAAGFAPWQWTRQSRLWNNASEAEKWDDDLGIFTHEDGSLKLSGKAFPSLINAAKITLENTRQKQ